MKAGKLLLGILAISGIGIGLGFAFKNNKAKRVDPNTTPDDNSSNAKKTHMPEYNGTDKTWDKITDRNIELMHPMVRPYARKLINEAEKEGIKLRATSTLRTYPEQTKLYSYGRTDKSKAKVTNAQAGESAHNFGTGMDVVPIVNGKADWNTKEWPKIAAIGKKLGFEWGGDWHSIKDQPHFEMNFGLTLAQLRSRYESGNKTGDYVVIA